jgi:hypothetical protein
VLCAKEDEGVAKAQVAVLRPVWEGSVPRDVAKGGQVRCELPCVHGDSSQAESADAKPCVVGRTSACGPDARMPGWRKGRRKAEPQSVRSLGAGAPARQALAQLAVPMDFVPGAACAHLVHTQLLGGLAEVHLVGALAGRPAVAPEASKLP